MKVQSGGSLGTKIVHALLSSRSVGRAIIWHLVVKETVPGTLATRDMGRHIGFRYEVHALESWVGKAVVAGLAEGSRVHASAAKGVDGVVPSACT